MTPPLTELLTVAQTPLARASESFRAGSDRWTGLSLSDRDPQVIQDLLPLFRWFYRHYFRVQTEGWEKIPDEPVLLVGAHNGGLAAPDLFMTMVDWFDRVGVERQVYGLMNPKMWTAYPGISRLAARAGAVRAHPKMAIAAIKAGASVLVYPGGAKDVFRHHSLRQRIFLNGNMAFIKLAVRENLPIVPIVSMGAHDTFKVVADLYPVARQWHEQGLPWLLGIDPEVIPVYLGWPWGVGIGPIPHIPWPVPMRTRVGAPIRFARTGVQAAKEKDYLWDCYDKVFKQMQLSLDDLARKMLP